MELTHHSHLEGHFGAVYALCQLSDGSILSAGSDGYIPQWFPTDSQDALLFARTNGPVFSLFATDEYVYIGQQNGLVTIVRTSDKSVVKQLNYDCGEVFAFERFNNRILIGTGSGVLLEVSAEDGSIHRKLQLCEKSIRRIRRVGNQLFVACSDHFIYVLNVSDLGLMQKLSGHENSVFDVLEVEKGVVWSGGRDARIRIYEQESEGWNPTKDINAHWYAINRMILVDECIVTASRDKSIRVWRKDGTAQSTIQSETNEFAHRHSVNDLLWMKERNLLLSASDDGRIGIFNVDSTK